MKKILVICLVMLMLVGCSNGGGGKPTVMNQKSDKEAYENLMEMTVLADSMNKDGEKETESFLFYVPKSKYADVYNNSAFSSENGLSIDVSINDYMYEEGEYADNVIGYVQEGLMENSGLLKVVRESEIVVDETRDNASYNSLIIQESYDNQGEVVYNYVAAKEISPKQRVLIQVTIYASEYNKLTEAMMKELNEYYGIEIGFNLEEATEALKQFNLNPPTTKKYDAYDFSFEIPFNYGLDYELSDYTEDDYIFGPDGDGSYYDSNLEVMVITDEAPQYTADELIITITELFTEYEGGLTEVSVSDFTSEGKSNIRCRIYGDGEYLDGYIVSMENYLIYVSAVTDKEELDAQQLEIIQNVIHSLELSY
ncbi:hypothetical protein [Anaerorhabdus sp.]|uniref:hypothetical protein n=1 Tax=Anaerorhabdus sp. TaxID=1872524 RepID=UPI002FC70168